MNNFACSRALRQIETNTRRNGGNPRKGAHGGVGRGCPELHERSGKRRERVDFDLPPQGQVETLPDGAAVASNYGHGFLGSMPG